MCKVKGFSIGMDHDMGKLYYNMYMHVRRCINHSHYAKEQMDIQVGEFSHVPESEPWYEQVRRQ
jgi:uncharacterized radical SAM superfamily Fe-S cluster-containing enzyme